MELLLLTLGGSRTPSRPVEALLEHDDAGAAPVVAGDDEIDVFYPSSTTGCSRSGAVKAPDAAALRLVSVISHSACI
jgi:hypothetical protein